MKLNRKNKILLFAFVLVLYLSYKFAISRTIDTFKEYSAAREVLEAGTNAPVVAMQLQQREKQLDYILSQYKISEPLAFQNDLLKQLSEYSLKYQLRIVDFQEPHVINDGNVVITSYLFSLQGPFNGALALLNKLESDRRFGSVRHVNFTKKKNYKTNQDELFTEVLLVKNVENKANMP